MAGKGKLKPVSDPFIHRKEIAARRHVSSETVRRCERKWGIAEARDSFCEKPARYRRNHPAVRRLIESYED